MHYVEEIECSYWEERVKGTPVLKGFMADSA
jgi:hypothetical protein